MRTDGLPALWNTTFTGYLPLSAVLRSSLVYNHWLVLACETAGAGYLCVNGKS